MPSFLGQDFTPDQMNAVVAMMVMAGAVGICLFVWLSDVYRLLPGWGPIRKFDGDCRQEHLERQQLIYKHAEQLQATTTAKQESEKNPTVYGAIGKPTWGVLESANHRTTKLYHPVHGHCQMRDGFHETQKMRMASNWWAKDEPHFIAKRGLLPPEGQINEPYLSMPAPMV
eukprot:TRINITY_DN48054_c0_g1_i1.p1 TRINITY_DN48054_c0_g1~~TRINITY_DN48054_c0_g1_i1.p1  ORF type:complete len:171 (-),score=35.36 TRINITY_DN48054_c0_g1_i1:87-599(-)